MWLQNSSTVGSSVQPVLHCFKQGRPALRCVVNVRVAAFQPERSRVGNLVGADGFSSRDMDIAHAIASQILGKWLHACDCEVVYMRAPSSPISRPVTDW